MSGFLFLTLVSVWVLLGSCDAQDDFSKLPEDYKRGVELAVQQINSHEGIKSHFNFFKSLSKSDIDGGFAVNYIYHHFYLKATRCPKGTSDANPSKCAFRNDRIFPNPCKFLCSAEHTGRNLEDYRISSPIDCHSISFPYYGSKRWMGSEISSCVFSKTKKYEKPLIDCGICYKMHRGEIQNEPKPYIHCVHKPKLTQDLMSARVEHCAKMSYTNGSPTLLAARKPQ